MNKTLLEKAKELNAYKARNRFKFTKEDVDLIAAWLDQEITMSQIKRIKNIDSGATIYTYITLALKYAYRKGFITIKEAK